MIGESFRFMEKRPVGRQGEVLKIQEIRLASLVLD